MPVGPKDMTENLHSKAIGWWQAFYSWALGSEETFDLSLLLYAKSVASLFHGKSDSTGLLLHWTFFYTEKGRCAFNCIP